MKENTFFITLPGEVLTTACEIASKQEISLDQLITQALVHYLTCPTMLIIIDINKI